MRTSPSKSLGPAEAEAFGHELDALRAEVVSDLGQRDVDHIRRVFRTAHGSEMAGRLLLQFGVDPVSFAAGVVALSVGKILENMEVGHNVMHGQYDWTADPALDSHTYEWDIACPSEHWRHSHNYEHHTFTNVVGKDRDVGYLFLRICAEQPWRVQHLAQPLVALLLACGFEWGVATHDLRIAETLAGKQSIVELVRRARPFLDKARWQLFKDYGLYPALALGNAPRVLLGNMLANLGRNLWTFAIIFCGHFPDGVRFYSEEEAQNETRGQWYVRQLNGSANIEGPGWLHVLSGHLSHQIEHHLFPDLPAARYPELAPRVRAVARRYGQTYCTGSFGRQLATVARRLLQFSLPGRWQAR